MQAVRDTLASSATLVGRAAGRQTLPGLSANRSADPIGGKVTNHIDSQIEASDRRTSRELGHSVRAETLDALTSSLFGDVLRQLQSGKAGLTTSSVLSAATANAILRDLEADAGWTEEHWILKPGGDVAPASRDEFESVDPVRRFSHNDCLRKPAHTSWALRGFLSALVSDEARVALSSAFGQPVRFRSADMARYTCGHYLRRHSDDFESRRFGFVWFFSPDWQLGAGGELLIESEAGDALVVPPLMASVAALAFRPSCHHQVARVKSSLWARYSVATHFASDERDGDVDSKIDAQESC